MNNLESQWYLMAFLAFTLWVIWWNHGPPPIGKFTHGSLLGVHAQGLAMGPAGPLWGESGAALCWTRPAPAAPKQTWQWPRMSPSVMPVALLWSHVSEMVKQAVQQLWERSEKMRNSHGDTKVREGWAEGSSGSRADTAASPPSSCAPTVYWLVEQQEQQRRSWCCESTVQQ